MPVSSTRLIGIDTETTMRCVREGFSSSTVWDTSNRILCLVLKGNLTPSIRLYGDSLKDANRAWSYSPSDIVVGHNLKFDLHYLHKDLPELHELVMRCQLWDTSIAEYILSGQRSTFPRLRDVAAKRCPDSAGKSDLLEKTIEKGKTTEDIEMEELLDYCQKDVEVTLEVAMDQMREATSRDPKLMNLIMLHSNVTKALSDMEWNGIGFNGAHALDETVKAVEEINGFKLLISKDVENRVAATLSVERAGEVAKCIDQWLNSNQFWSSYLFGGCYKISRKVPNGEWKSGKKKGQVKYTTVSTDVEFLKAYDPVSVGSERTKSGDWCVDESVLKRIPSPTIKYLQDMRKTQKILNTYLTTLPTKCWLGTIHPSINQTVTHTGRTSQSNPNLQNVANEDRVKSCFVPRHFDLGFIEADYKQLEMLVFAHVYKDPQLMDDLSKGWDIHNLIGKQLYGASYDESKRRKVKGVVFGMIYGGGSKTLSEQVGLPQTEVQKVINIFMQRYRTIRPTRARLIDAATNSVSATSTAHAGVDETGQWLYYMPSDTGRVYAIPLEKKIVSSGVRMEPHYTAICNYPIQGLATGDIVPMMVYHLWQRINEEQLPITMINTVHDSILFEAPVIMLENYAGWIKNELEKAPQIFEALFDVPIDLALPVSVKYTEGTWAGPWKEYKPF